MGPTWAWIAAGLLSFVMVLGGSLWGTVMMRINTHEASILDLQGARIRVEKDLEYIKEQMGEVRNDVAGLRGELGSIRKLIEGRP